MCGIVGIFSSQGLSDDARQTLTSMRDSIIARGPDDGGVWLDEPAGIALGHRRLSILDLSPAGHQPMHSTCGRYVLAFNGEVYNHLVLRAELTTLGAAPEWRGHSDTETLLAGFVRWGVEATLSRAVGMFAIALWDKENRTLTLARDRMGEKPLYYGISQGVFLFASEIKAFRAFPGFEARVDRGALALYLRHGYIPTPYSILEGVRKLTPGCVVTLAFPQAPVQERPYWSMREVLETERANPFRGSAKEATDALEHVLSASVGLQMVADVPLGAFLSGGVDSSTVVALMQAQSSRPVKTFTIGFGEAEYDEGKHAARVARHLGTEHHEWYVTPQDALGVIPKLPLIWDEPFADSSQIPTCLVASLAKRHVTVSLSGDGGDELFWGYSRYFEMDAAWRKVGWLPRGARAMGAGVLRMLSPATWETLIGNLGPFVAGPGWKGRTGDRLHKIADILNVGGRDHFYRESVSLFKTPAALVRGLNTEPAVSGWAATAGIFRNYIEEMAYRDTLTYLPDDILVKVDRAAMAVSLEGRIPLLDHRVVEFAASLPGDFKVRDGKGKWLLREVLYRHVPREIIDRPKQGFGVPIDSWLRGPLREWAESLLDERKMVFQGYFDVGEIRKLWEEHLSGIRNWQHYLWTVLMFQAWLKEWED